jgi:signal-transduction protein with cAMP-binding, CBS, and nucleotidyltransferase domain
MRVRDIMTQPVQTCTTEMNLAAASRRMKDTGCGTLVVLQCGRIAGILTDRDLALAICNVREPARVTVGKVMTGRVHTCRRDDDVHVVLDTMTTFMVRRLPVISETGDVEGMISIDDIILWATPQAAVSQHALIAALRSICSASSAAIHEISESCASRRSRLLPVVGWGLTDACWGGEACWWAIRGSAR